jgi:transposase
MSSKHKSEDYKLSAVRYFLVGDESQTEVCKIFRCSPRSLMRWVEKYEKDGEIKRNNRKPIAYKVHKKHVNFLLDMIKINKTITMGELMIKLKEKYNIELSRYHINRIINDNNITLKLTKIRHVPIKRFGKDIDIKKNLKEFYAKIKNYELKNIICIDETSISGLQKRKHCYNNLGKRCTIETQSQDVFKKYTAIFAISVDGVLGWKLYNSGGIDGDRLYNFLEKNITSKFKNKLVILDNASSHRNERIKDLINKDNTLLYSIPYQHFTNAIENYFSMLKSKLQKMSGETFDELRSNIKKTLKEIQKDNYKK